MSVQLDYILEAEALRDACRQNDLLTDPRLLEWEMLMRLRVNEVEVFGQSDADYHAWLESLRRNGVRLHVPSPAWSPLSVLWIAASVEDAFARLELEGRSDLDSLDGVIRLERQGETVRLYLRRDRRGQASLAEVKAVFVAFAERVRDDFLAICPQLRQHCRLGYWFRHEVPPPRVPPPPILL